MSIGLENQGNSEHGSRKTIELSKDGKGKTNLENKEAKCYF